MRREFWVELSNIQYPATRLGTTTIELLLDNGTLENESYARSWGPERNYPILHQ